MLKEALAKTKES